MSDDKELLLGEVTPEVAEFLRSMGKEVPRPPDPDVEWRASKPVHSRKRVSRHAEHYPHAWGPLESDRFPHIYKTHTTSLLELEEEFGHELGMRVAFHMKKAGITVR